MLWNIFGVLFWIGIFAFISIFIVQFFVSWHTETVITANHRAWQRRHGIIR